MFTIKTNYRDIKPPLGFQLNFGHPLAQGLVACFLMNEGGGNIVRDLVNGYVGTNQSTCRFTSTQKGIGTNFPRSTNSDYYSLGQPARLVSGFSKITLECLALARVNDVDQMHLIAQPYTDSGAVSDPYSRYSLAFGSQVPATPLPTFEISTGGSGTRTQLYQNTEITINKWYHLVGTYDGANMRLYNNGILIAGPTAKTGGIPATAVNVNIGRQAGWTGEANALNGYIIFVRIYNRALSPSEIQQLYVEPYCFVQPIRRRFISVSTTGATAALTGTVTTATEADIVAGGKTIILTLTGDTWIAAGAASFDLQRQNIINGLTSAQSETFGWNLVPKALQSVGGVVRTSDTVVTITLDAFPTYNISATETIIATIPASALVGNTQIVASPTFSITPVTVSAVGMVRGSFLTLGVG